MRKGRPGPYRSRLDDLDLTTLATGPISTALPSGEEPSKLAYCPLLDLYTGKKLCGSVDCRNCQHLLLAYSGAELGWFCTTCSDGHRALPYWGDGRCTGCGRESSVLVGCVLAEE